MKFIRLSHDGVTSMLIARFRLQYCWSSSGDEVDCLRVAICSTLVRSYWCISILSLTILRDTVTTSWSADDICLLIKIYLDGRTSWFCMCSPLHCPFWLVTLSIGSHWSAVELFDRGYPGFGNINSTIPIDDVGMKSFMDSLFDPTCVPVGVTINKLNLAPKRNMLRFVSVLRNRRGLSTSKLCVFSSSCSCSFILSRINLPVSPIYTLPHSHGIL